MNKTKGVQENTLKTVKAISQGWKALSLLEERLTKLWNSSSHKTTPFSSSWTRLAWASPVKFLTTAFLRRELRASLGPFQRISTANVLSGDRSVPRRVLTRSLTSYFFETGGGHGLHFIILTTMLTRCCGGGGWEKGQEEEEKEEEEERKASWEEKQNNYGSYERIRVCVLCFYTNAVLL